MTTIPGGTRFDRPVKEVFGFLADLAGLAVVLTSFRAQTRSMVPTRPSGWRPARRWRG